MIDIGAFESNLEQYTRPLSSYVYPLVVAGLLGLAVQKKSASGETLAGIASGFASGGTFAFGLGVSGMCEPDKVRAFLDARSAFVDNEFTLGVTSVHKNLNKQGWDPTLAIVAGTGMCVALLTFPLSFSRLRRGALPLFASKWNVPTLTTIDKKLLIGSSIFGMFRNLYCIVLYYIILYYIILYNIMLCIIITSSIACFILIPKCCVTLYKIGSFVSLSRRLTSGWGLTLSIYVYMYIYMYISNSFEYICFDNKKMACAQVFLFLSLLYVVLKYLSLCFCASLACWNDHWNDSFTVSCCLALKKIYANLCPTFHLQMYYVLKHLQHQLNINLNLIDFLPSFNAFRFLKLFWSIKKKSSFSIFSKICKKTIKILKYLKLTKKLYDEVILKKMIEFMLKSK
ncbi:hypothetical protein RFI_06916 [Reticulomyxa filosa]|uniref:Uncharacterized protein n=1 Tax=Reticulomyxa filosa TaxID=46433 RepID=X6NY34_RETFI|nr:hypothetical protein RFI_06916 [Reticulomyxa filosa]|eukprot:ETO30202.1 hypothetical protein RFI_06916 [Reticulomyxa filosa]